MIQHYPNWDCSFTWVLSPKVLSNKKTTSLSSTRPPGLFGQHYPSIPCDPWLFRSGGMEGTTRKSIVRVKGHLTETNELCRKVREGQSSHFSKRNTEMVSLKKCHTKRKFRKIILSSSKAYFSGVFVRLLSSIKVKLMHSNTSPGKKSSQGKQSCNYQLGGACFLRLVAAHPLKTTWKNSGR